MTTPEDFTAGYDDLMAGIEGLLDEAHPLAKEISETTGLKAGVMIGDPRLTPEQQAMNAAIAARDKFLFPYIEQLTQQILHEGVDFGSVELDSQGGDPHEEEKK